MENGEMHKRVVVLGANGRFGRVAVQAFAEAGWQVLAQVRHAGRQRFPSAVQVLECDARESGRVLEACPGGVDVVVNALNPRYDRWDADLMPLTDAALALAEGGGALLMLPGNVYNFGRLPPALLDEQSPPAATTSKAALRIAVERKTEEAAFRGVRSVVIRAGDFIGGSAPGTWIDIAIASKLHKNRFVYPGPLDVEHAWAYLPDLARTFVEVAERRAALPAFAVFHYAGLTVTGRELHAAYERACGRRLRMTAFPWWLLRLASPFSSMLRSVLEMRYLWQRPHRLVQEQLDALIGAHAPTALDHVVRATLPPAGHALSR